MNPEELITEASEAIAEFEKTNDRTCSLYIRNGHVQTCLCEELSTDHPHSLQISPYEQKHGCIASHWRSISTELLNLYNLEKACQNPPKP